MKLKSSQVTFTDKTVKNKNLSIQFSLDGFYFCIKDSDTKEPISLSEYQFEKPLIKPEDLLDKLTVFFDSEKELQQDFNIVTAIHQHNLASLVPNDYFNESNLNDYLNYNVKTLSTDHITFDDITAIKAKNIYIPYVNINNYLFQNFGEFEFKHHSSILIDTLINNYSEDDKTHFFVNVFKHSFDIVYIHNSELKLYNHFSFETKEDFIYYILFVAEQLNLNPDEFQLTFLGHINDDSPLYDISYKYVRYIDFITPKVLENHSNNLNHSNFILLA